VVEEIAFNPNRL